MRTVLIRCRWFNQERYQKGHFKTMETTQLKVNATVVASHRKALSNVGKTFGGQYFRVSQEDTNQHHAQDVIESENNNNLDLVLNRSPRRFKVVGTDIVAVEIGEDAQGASMVYINRGRKKQVGDKIFDQQAVIPVTSEMRVDSDASDDSILAEALKGDKSKIFADADLPTEKMNILNDNEIVRIDKLILKLQGWRKLIIDTKNSNIDKARRYRAERTNNACENVTVKVDVDQIVSHESIPD